MGVSVLLFVEDVLVDPLLNDWEVNTPYFTQSLALNMSHYFILLK